MSQPEPEKEFNADRRERLSHLTGRKPKKGLGSFVKISYELDLTKPFLWKAKSA